MQKLCVSDAVDRRMSARAFTPASVPAEMIRDILEKARRTPSGGNVQPWKIDVLTGAALTEFKQLIAGKLASGMMEEPEYDVYPAKLWEPHRTYRYEIGEEMYALIGIERDNKMGRMMQMAKNFQFFDAPVGLFFSLNKKFGPPQWSDLGMLMQTIMLLAVERGLDTCAQEAWSRWPKAIKEFCGHDDEMMVFSGMAMGYRNEDHPINRLRSARAGLDEFVTFHGTKE